ncbi:MULTISPECIES: ribosome silencing factor [Gammaproteobacteria]|uniref:ribosome silencing factor n=1 Tax=Gammaproteobacteria TaxID=1236 RepID=UPI000DD053FB|nr:MULTISPECIES: ribosome silencing factor [Gammaproteobacteria]RTE87454.1 ribosome silencing factor [Aliidiomarina sp. B3213]TCZ92761.1 ribosome silencing factor [Lysobacter sp. N42]
MQATALRDFVVDKAEDIKARDIQIIDISDKTDVTDFLVICSGNSKTHVKSIANHIATEAKHAGNAPLGLEGEDESEWVLVDLGDVVVHVMQDSARDFYQLEKLWGHP